MNHADQPDQPTTGPPSNYLEPGPTAPERSRRARAVRIAALSGLAGALLAAAIGGATWFTLRDGESSFAGATLSGIDISVGSRDDPEGLILGSMLVLAYREAGAEVESRVGAGNGRSIRQELGADRIDAAIEYNGLTYRYVLKRDDPPSDPSELTDRVAELDRLENGIVWLGRSAFNNAYGFAVAPGLAADPDSTFDLESMATYLDEHPESVVCTLPSGNVNPDGLSRFEQLTGYTVPQGQRVETPLDEIASATSTGTCDFSEFAATNGEIQAEGLTLVESEDRLEIHNASVTMREQVYQEAPEDFSAIASAVLDSLDDETMRSLNAQVAVDGEDPEQVAKDYLVSVGMIES